MTDTPLIGGRFTFDPSTQTLEVWFNSGVHEVLGPEAEFDKVLRGQIPIKLTGGQATRKSSLTWSEQLAGKMEAEASRLINGAKINRYSPKGRLEISLKDLDLGAALAGLSLPTPKEKTNAVHEGSASQSNSESVSDPTDPGAE